MRSITILGATGSIGQSTLDLVKHAPDMFSVQALTANKDVAGLAAAARENNAKSAIIGDPALYTALKEALAGTSTVVAAGPDAIVAAAAEGADLTMAAIIGCVGLMPVMAALEAGNTIALANKEALVSAGDLMLAAARRTGARLLPTDSEHNAIFQCLDQSAPKGVAKIILTASGGPFRTWSAQDMRAATPEQALKHPNWSMGAKITIDSATMFNKGLELIEAHYLFNMPRNRLDVLFHPQSIIHSMVEYIDGSVLAQLGPADMRVPIAHCLAWPDRMDTPVKRLNLAEIARLDFEEPDLVRFPALRLAYEAMETGGARPAILNAANEVAVAAFLERRVCFGAIADIVQATLDVYDPACPTTLQDVLAVDAEARRIACAKMESIPA